MLRTTSKLEFTRIFLLKRNSRIPVYFSRIVNKNTIDQSRKALLIRQFSSNEDLRKVLNNIKNKGTNQDEISGKSSSDNIKESSDSLKESNASTTKVDSENISPSETGNNETAEKSNEKENQASEGESSGEKPSTPSFSFPSLSFEDIVKKSRDGFYYFQENVKLAYSEMIGETKESLLKSKIHQAENTVFRRKDESGDEDGEDAESKQSSGPSSIVLVKEAKSPWEAMRDRLQDSPLIKEAIKRGRKIGKVAADTDIGKKAQDIGRSVQDKIHDMREFWETSQNPVVYALSGVWDNVTGETEEGVATAAIRKHDKNFSKEEWAAEVRENLIPIIVKAHMEGDTKTLKPWMSEAVYSKLSAEIRARKADGFTFDSRILQVDENQIIMSIPENGSPTIVVVYMIQQINCIRNKAGEIVEGGESEIRAKFYMVAFQQAFLEDESEMVWKIVEYSFAGDIPYI